MTRIPRGLAANVLLALLSTVIILAGLEVGARLLGLQKGLFLLFTPDHCMRTSKLLGFEQEPSCTARSGKVTWVINAHGLRGPEIRDDQSTRILALGDSSTWGWAVNQDQSYPVVLQGLLDAKFGPNRYQVINGGVPGYTSYQGLVYLRERGLALHPAIVIIGFGFNDALKAGDEEGRITFQAKWQPFFKVDHLLLEWSTFYSWLRWKIHTTGSTTPREQRVVPEKYEHNLTEMVRLARAQGARVLLLGLVQPTDDQRVHVEALARISEELSVPLLVYEGPRLDAVHPTVPGLQKLGADLLDRLEKEGFIG